MFEHPRRLLGDSGEVVAFVRQCGRSEKFLHQIEDRTVLRSLLIVGRSTVSYRVDRTSAARLHAPVQKSNDRSKHAASSDIEGLDRAYMGHGDRASRSRRSISIAAETNDGAGREHLRSP